MHSELLEFMFFELILTFPVLIILFSFDKKQISSFLIKFRLCAFNFEFINFKFYLNKFPFFSIFFSNYQASHFLLNRSLISQLFCCSIVRLEQYIGLQNSVYLLFNIEIALLGLQYLKSTQWSMKIVLLTMKFCQGTSRHN